MASNESETSLDRALDAFNYKSQVSMDSTQLEPILKQLKDRRVFITSTYSKQDTITSASDLGSDLWGMHSTHNSREISPDVDIADKTEQIEANNEPTKNQKNTKKTQKESPSKTMCSIIARDGPFDRFQHIKSTKIPSFYPFIPSPNGTNLIHFRGSSPPLCTMQTVHRGSKREYHRLLIPPIYDGQTELVLCCRKKRNGTKFRFSTDEQRMEKKKNPHYVGKMKVTEWKKGQYVMMTLTMNDEKNVAAIKMVIEPNGSHFMEIMLCSGDNLVEVEKDRNVLKGSIHRFVSPKLSLRVAASQRIVMKVVECVSSIDREMANPMTRSSEISNVQMIDFDYPLSIFVSFAIASAMNSWNSFL